MNGNQIIQPTIVYIEVSPKKLSNREVSKVYDSLYRQGKLAQHDKLTNTLQKAQYIRNSERFVTIRIPDTRIPAFLGRSGITRKDINTVRGGTHRDLDQLEAEAESEDDLGEYKYPAIKLEPENENEDLSTTIINAIQKMDNDPRNLMEGTGNMDISLAVRADSEDEALKDAVEEEVNLDQSNSSGWDDLDQTIGQVELTSHTTSVGVLPTVPPRSSTLPVLMTQTADGKDKTDMKLDAGGSIPIWKKSSDKKEEVQNVRMYIRDLKRLKTLKVLRNEALLINASLVKSGRTSLYEEMPKEAEESVDEFVKYLQTAYGLTRIDMMRDLQNLKQGRDESPYTFLSRVITLYYEARGEAKKTAQEVIGNKIEKFEITKLFLDGLYDNRISVQLQSRIDELKFSELALTAKNAASALQRSATASINHIEQAEEQTLQQLERAIDVLNINSDQRARKNWRTNSGKENRHAFGACYSCGKRGHRAKDCRSKTNKEQRKCFFCNKIGHLERDCRAKKRGSKPEKSEGKERRCYNCNKPGHFARECRAPKST